MSDTLGGIQRHSSPSYWGGFTLIEIQGDSTSKDHWPVPLWYEMGKDREHDKFTIARHGNITKGVLMPDNDVDWWLQECMNLDMKVSTLFLFSRPDACRNRMVYDMRRVCLGVVSSLGTHAQHLYSEPLSFKSDSTGHIFAPRMTGWLANDRLGKSEIVVNKPSEGARYHDYRNIA